MRPSDLGTWGVGLSRNEFDNALAAALVLSAGRPREWRHPEPETYALLLLGRLQDPGTPSKAVPALEKYRTPENPYLADTCYALYCIRGGEDERVDEIKFRKIGDGEILLARSVVTVLRRVGVRDELSVFS